mgnify:CR=1 FL=1
MSRHAMLIEDEPNIAEAIRFLLGRDGWQVTTLGDGGAAEARVRETRPDLLILDLMLPGMDGLSFCQRLRTDAGITTPVLMLTARDTLDDKLKGFAAGADDYLVKPFALQELHARLQALYKRSHGKTDNLLTVADLTLNKSTLQVHRGGQRLEVNPACLKLLQRLMEQAPAVVMRDELETLLWADEPPDGDALRSHMYKLRQAIDRPFARPLIHTVHRIGYRIAENGH